MKLIYKVVCKAILEAPKENQSDLLRRWIMLFEETKVDNWNRDDFLDYFIEIKGGKK